MEQKFSVSEFRRTLSKSDFLLKCRMPLGYSQGLPILRRDNEAGGMILETPFLRYQITGKEDETLVYPIRYTVSAEMPSGKNLTFKRLEENSCFDGVDFLKPVGRFRHARLSKFSKVECGILIDALFQSFDDIIGACGDEKECRKAVQEATALIDVLLTPELRRFYRLLDEEFYNNYIAATSNLKVVDVQGTEIRFERIEEPTSLISTPSSSRLNDAELMDI